MKKLNVITLGCSKNVVDSEHISAQLAAAGWAVVFDSDQPSDVVVINTCGFIGDAKEESIDTILNFAEAKSRGEIERLYVIGCLSERYRDELREELPEVDSFFGARDITGVVRELGHTWNDGIERRRLLSTPGHYAYLKISEGCSRACGFCAIPLIRGKHVSVPMEELVAEAESLVRGGVRELMVIAQDTTYYGMDLYGERKLAELLERLCRVEGLEWIRLHYAYPAAFPDDVIEVMAREPKICKYLDIPIQHISDRMLTSMKRGLDAAGTIALLEKLRSRIPGIALRTTLLVGYPGETQEDFDALMDFVARMKFDRLGVFPYSEEEGTYAGENLPDDVPEELKQERAARLMELQQSVSEVNNTRRIGSRERIIIDRTEGDFVIGRTQYDSPEVDQEVLVPISDFPDGELPAGTFIDVFIDSCEGFDLYGTKC